MCVEKGGLRRTCLCITKGQYTNTYIHKSTPLAFKWLFPDSSVGKESTCDAGDSGSIPGSGRSPGEGIGYPLQYSGLENSMDCIVYGVTKVRRD